MGDLLLDDFDVDALLDAQSSDDDGSDLSPELERSLDDILNDTEFACILGDSAYVKSSSVATSRIDLANNAEVITDGPAAVGLEGEETIGNSLSGLEYPNGEESGIADEISSTGYEADRRTEKAPADKHLNVNYIDSPPTIEGLSFSGTHGIVKASHGERIQDSTEGIETTGSKRIAATSANHSISESNGRAFRAPGVANLPPQFAINSRHGALPGAAIAAAAAASRLPRVGSIYALQKSSSTGTLENESNRLETDGNSSLLSQFSDDATAAIHEPFSTASDSEVAKGNFQNTSGVFANDGRLDFDSELGGSSEKSSIQWNNDKIHAAAIADLSDEVEMLSTLVSQLHEQPGYSSSSDSSAEGGESEQVPGQDFAVIMPDGYSSDSAPDIDDGVGASEVKADVEVTSKTIVNYSSESSAEPDVLEPESSDVASLNNWIEETHDHGLTSTEGTLNSQLLMAQSFAPRRNSIHNAVQQAIDEQNEPKASVEKKIDSQQVDEKPQLTALQIAEELERNEANSGLHWEEGAVAQPMRLEGIQRGAPAIGLLQLDSGGAYTLQSSALRREHGLPQALAVHSNFIAIGLSKGGILVTPSKYSATRSADETDSKPFVLATPGPDKSVSSMCFNQQGDLLLVGYSNGHLVLWDVPKANVIKTLEKEHSGAIVHTLFLGQDVPGARNFKAITSDSKGLTSLHTFTVLPVPVLRRYTVNTTCILDGQRTGIVLSVSPLLPEEGSQGAGVSTSAPYGSSVPMNLSTVMGVVGGATGGDVGRKFLYDGAPSSEEGGGGLVVFVTHQVALVVRLLPTVDVCARLPRPEGIREGAIPYTAWRRTKSKSGIPTGSLGTIVPSNTSSVESVPVLTQRDADSHTPENFQSQEDGDGGEHCPSLAIAWDRKVLIYQLPKSELKSVAQWEVDSPAVGVAWLEEQMMVVATANDQLCLFTNEGVEIERATVETEQGGIGAFIYHTHFMNLYGNPEKAFHNALAGRGAALYVLGPSQLWRARLLPWRERIKALENAGDWMGAFHIAMEIYDGRSQGVTGLPRGLEAMREAIMPTLLALLSAYIDEAFAYLSLALGPSPATPVMKIAPEPIKKMYNVSQTQKVTVIEPNNGVEPSVQQMVVEAREQYARVGGVAIEFCVHICKTEVLFENVFSKFEAVDQRGTFLELLEPYILKDMLCGLAPEVMQALVEHYSSRGWLNRVEQCVLHMDIASLDFNQVVLVCRDHGLYSALIYLFTKGLDDFKSPLEELLAVAQNSVQLSLAKAFGYKVLVYLKYCFTGLAFPPGNGTLSLSRLPKLRAELLSYILDPVETRQDGGIDGETRLPKLYPRLQYLLKLDTQASLLVLGAAFPEEGPLGVGKHCPSMSSRFEQGNALNHQNLQSKDSGESGIEGLKLAQDTIDAIVHILQIVNNAGRASESEEMGALSKEQWPTDKDTGDMLEFVAHFAAEKNAVVTTAIMSQILEHLSSPSVKGSEELELTENKKLAIQKQREDLMVALLSAVPKSKWDAQRTLQLAQNTGYWQVTALIYAQKDDYTAALDSYLKDINRPQHPFTFVSHMLSPDGGLEGSSLSSFHEAVLSRLPELIQLSTLSTLLVVLEHFSNENQRILRELAPHPKLLFNYLKAVMNIRSGSLDKSQLELERDAASTQQSALGETLDWSHGVALSSHSAESSKDYSVLNSQVHLADLLQRSGLEFTDEMAETFVELLCHFEPNSVLRFLERYENYRLEHCLKLCQEYGITDAAAFLLERVGDVASALTLVLADVRKFMQEMDCALAQLVNNPSFTQNFQSFTKNQFIELTEVLAVHSVLHAAVALCQRNTFRLKPQESESLWFRLLDRFVEPLHSLNKQVKGTSGRKQHGMKSEVSHHPEQQQAPSRSSMWWKVWGSDVASKTLRKILVQFIGDIVNGMMGYVPMPVIMNKILEDHRGHEFGDFKGTILDMLSAYGYERAILGTAKQLIEDDTFQNISALKRGFTHAFSPSNLTCIVCEHRLDKPGFGSAKSKNKCSTSNVDRRMDEEIQSLSSDVKQLGIQIFPCGHATHLSCVDVHLGSESRQSLGTVVCPICSYKHKPVGLSSHGKDPSLLNSGVIKVGAGKAKQHDSIYPPYPERLYKTTNQVFGQSRLQLLKHLENGTELHEFGLPLKLTLAPLLPQKQRENLPLKLTLAPLLPQKQRENLHNNGSAHLRGGGKSSLATRSKGDNSQRKSKPRIR